MAHFVEELNMHPTLMQRVGNFMGELINSTGRARELERLASMTDEQLAERGLRRDRLAEYVFRDMGHI